MPDYFRNSYRYVWSETEEISDLRLNLNAAESHTISFKTPVLMCQGCLSAGSDFTNLFEMNVKTTVYRQETSFNSLVPGTKTVFATFDSGALSMSQSTNSSVYSILSGRSAHLRIILGESKREQSDKAGDWSYHYLLSPLLAETIAEASNKKTIEFTIPALTASEIEAGKGYFYSIECVANPINPSAMFGFYEAVHNGWGTYQFIGSLTRTVYSWDIYRGSATTVVDANSVKVTTAFWHKDMSVVTEGGPFIIKGVKYSCYELLRKALLTCDTHVINNSTTSLDEYNNLGQPQPSLSHSIILDDAWNNRLKSTKVNETIFEGKNLWEVLLQIGYYIHAVPYLEFADDGTDRFILRFRQLGSTVKNVDNSIKITVFNSNNLSEYFTQYDSYVTNLFSPQNLVEEDVVVKTSDPSFLVKNDNAELQLSYAITELIEFDIALKLNGEWELRSALNHVFEKSIYDILSNENPYYVYPSKGAALYFNLGDNKIQGLNFVPPSVNDDLPMALKRIIQIVWQGTEIGEVADIKFNDLRFHVKYRTQDTARINQLRPDIGSFMKNSAYEKYPHHEQFFGQQDKIIDSERFSANLFGKLIRIGNGILQRQEYARLGDERQSGDLISIDSDAYYVTAVENEYYADAIFQNVTYSKNFNQLANIVTIPSEPRFYEVSERSKIRREVRLMDFFAISNQNNSAGAPRFLNNDSWKDFIKRIIFNKQPATIPNYAWTRFKVDELRSHSDSSGLVISNDKMFPSSLIDRTGTNPVPETPSDHVDCIVPLLHFPLRNGIVFAWDMVDNFKAGDFIDTSIEAPGGEVDDAYVSMQPMRYVDVMGRADLFSFKLFYQQYWHPDLIQELPQAARAISDAESVALVKGGDSYGVALDKDCREEISFNYQINILYEAGVAGENNFITYANLFGQKDSPLKMCFLSEPQSMFDENINFSTANTIADNVVYELIDGDNAIEVSITQPIGIDLGDVKSVVLYQENETGGRHAYIVKNVAALQDADKLQSWWICPVFNN